MNFLDFTSPMFAGLWPTLKRGQLAFLWPAVGHLEWWEESDDFGWARHVPDVGEPFQPFPSGRLNSDWGPGPWLVLPLEAAGQRVTEQITKNFHIVEPLGVRNLFRRFAALDSDTDIRNFAVKYGLLGHSTAVVDEGKASRGFGESHSRWILETSRIGNALRIWDMLRRRDRKRLSEYVRWIEGTPYIRFFVPDPSAGLPKGYLDGLSAEARNEVEAKFAATRSLPGFPIVESRDLQHLDWRMDDPFEPAQYWLLHEINGQIRGHVSPAIASIGEGRIFQQPDCLLSALWIQLMREVTGQEAEAIQCNRSGCERFFVPTHAKQRYCSSECRKLQYWHNSPTSPKQRDENRKEEKGGQEG